MAEMKIAFPLSALPLRLGQFPHVVQKLFHRDPLLRISLAVYRDPRFLHSLSPAGYKRVPPGEGFSFIEQAVGAGFGEPHYPP